ncbi:YojF family protein [Tuberibacillus sp. Marseille-P3662]|uniref:YojF family protein n=1 Tax=Tuberibacillus sp. Marseille-P3662 TaxID=1965358 RepID=UPI000A1C94CA|nr:YojF family protein [Tuberibacillus sp. Marseille-P3662]
MEAIAKRDVQVALEAYNNKSVYLHLETTSGAYTGYRNQSLTASAYIRNTQVMFTRAVISGEGPFRVGLKLDQGWVYAEGLTDWEIDEQQRLLLAGHDDQGRLAVALEISEQPFD